MLELNSRFRLPLRRCAVTCVINRLCLLATQHVPRSRKRSSCSLMLCGGGRIAGLGNVLAALPLRPRQVFWMTVSGLWALGHVFCDPCDGCGDSGCMFTTRRIVSDYEDSFLKPLSQVRGIRMGFWNPYRSFRLSASIFATRITVSGPQRPFLQPLSQFRALSVHF